MLINILIVLAVIIVVFIIVVALRPSAFRITRSMTIMAPAAAVFANVQDFHGWEAWSPWAKLDPAATLTFSGSAKGVGASYAWSGNNKVGEGRMTITEAKASDLIRIKLDFTRPMKANNIAEFTFAPQGEGTLVTWSMSGTNGFIGKAFCLFMNMDKMVGGDFEKGLAQMKVVTEAAIKK